MYTHNISTYSNILGQYNIYNSKFKSSTFFYVKVYWNYFVWETTNYREIALYNLSITSCFKLILFKIIFIYKYEYVLNILLPLLLPTIS